MARSFLPVEKLVMEPYSGILGYPNATKRQLRSRIRELQDLEILSVCFEGGTRIGKLDVLGKGYVGVVVLARKKARRPVALKIRRLDSQRGNMRGEAELLQKANMVRVGPKLLSSSRNFIVMEYLEGLNIGDWAEGLSGKGSVMTLKNTIRCILEDCYNLDRAGFDHGELSSITKHVIVGRKSTLIDFESASIRRRVSNVTSATQGIFIGSGIAKAASRLYKPPPRQTIIGVLREYKKGPSRKSFERLLETLKL